MKKLLLSIISLSILLQSSFVYAESIENTTTDSDVRLLNNIGIYKLQDNMEETEELLTREKMAVQLSVFYNVPRNGEIHEYSGESVYKDIDTDYYLAYEIMLLTRVGCMSGFTDGTFKPDHYVTYSQAVKALITVLGYSEMAESYGGWFEGYMNAAESIGLTRGIGLSPNEFITKGQFTKLLMNALETKTTKIDIKEADKPQYTEDEILLNKMGYEKVKGIVSATENAGLFGKDAAGKNKIIINDILLECSGNFDEYLGTYVTAYYNQDKDMDFGMLADIEINERKTKTELVDADDICEETTASQFVYYDKNNKEKKITLKDDVTFIFNDRKLTFYNDENIKPKNGYVRLIDADGDSCYETVVVKSYVEFWVAGIYEKDGKVILSDELGNSTIEFDTEDDDFDVTISKNGKESGIGEILKNNIVSVAADKMSGTPLKILPDSRRYDIVISDITEEGVLNGIDKEDRKIIIGDKESDLANGFDFSRFSFNLGKEYTVYYNFNNEAVALKENPTDKYGFITKVFADDEDEETLYVKMYTQDGEFIIANMSSKVEIDGRRYKKANDIIDELTLSSTAFFKDLSFAMSNKKGMEQLVKYRLDSEDKVILLDTVKENKNKNDGLLFGVKMEGSSSTILHAFAGSQNFECGIGIDSSMVTFILPNDVSDEKGYGILSNGGVYSDVIKTDVYAYDLSETNVAKVCLMNTSIKDNVDTKESDNMMIVTKSVWDVDSEGMPMVIVSGVKVKTGLMYELAVAEDAENKEKIKPGMIIRWNADSTDRATYIEITYSPDDTGTVLNNITPTTSYYSDFRIAAGRALNVDDDFIMIGYDTDGVLKKETYALRNITNVFVFNKKAKEKVVKADINAVRTEKNFGKDASIIFSFQDYARLKTIIVYE